VSHHCCAHRTLDVTNTLWIWRISSTSTLPGSGFEPAYLLSLSLLPLSFFSPPSHLADYCSPAKRECKNQTATQITFAKCNLVFRGSFAFVRVYSSIFNWEHGGKLSCLKVKHYVFLSEYESTTNKKTIADQHLGSILSHISYMSISCVYLSLSLSLYIYI